MEMPWVSALLDNDGDNPGISCSKLEFGHHDMDYERRKRTKLFMKLLQNKRVFGQLTTLDLSHASLSLDNARSLPSIIYTILFLDHLFLAKHAFENQEAMTTFLHEWSVRGARERLYLQTLDLSGNNGELTAEGAKFLGRLTYCPLDYLHTLLLHDNESMGEEGLAAVFDVQLPPDEWYGLDDWYPRLGLERFRMLKKLSLPASLLHGQGLTAVNRGISTGRVAGRLEDIWIHTDQRILESEPPMCRFLIRAAQQRGKEGLEKLEVRFNSVRPVGDESMSSLFGAMGSLKNLKFLRAGWTGFGELSGVAVVTNFAQGHWDHLVTCDIAGASPGGGWVLNLAEALKTRPQLALRVLKVNCSNLQAIQALADVLATGACSQLEVLHVVAVRRDISYKDLSEGEASLLSAVKNRQVEVQVFCGGHHPADFKEFVQEYSYEANWRRLEAAYDEQE